MVWVYCFNGEQCQGCLLDFQYGTGQAIVADTVTKGFVEIEEWLHHWHLREDHDTWVHRCKSHSCKFLKVNGYHQQCYKAISNLKSEPSSSLTEALIYRHLSASFEPTSKEMRRRLTYYRLKLVDILSSRLPTEIARMVASFIQSDMDWMSRFITTERLLECKLGHYFENTEIDVRKPIVKKHTSFEGISYIAALQQGFEVGYSAITRIYLAENHSGILNIHFGNHMDLPTGFTQHNCWFRYLEYEDHSPIVHIKLETDGFKLRSIKSSKDTKFQSSTRWDVPCCHNSMTRFLRFNDPLKQLHFERFADNPENLIGISVAFSGGAILFIKGHTVQDSLDFYQNFDHLFARWMYFPLKPGEKISKIFEWSKSSDPTLLTFKVETNLGGNMVIGAWRRNMLLECVLDVNDFPRYPQIAFNSWRSSEARAVTAMATDITPNHEAKLVTSLPKVCNDFTPIPADCYFYTSASLKNVIGMQRCRTYNGFSGLMLHYEDGTRGCLGFVRLDWLESIVPTSGPIFMRVEHRWVCQKIIDIQYEDGSGYQCLKGPMIEWWVSNNGFHQIFEVRECYGNI